MKLLLNTRSFWQKHPNRMLCSIGSPVYPTGLFFMWKCAEKRTIFAKYRTIFAVMYTLRLPIKPHLRQFLITEYGNDVIRIDRKTPLGIMLHAFLTKKYELQHNYQKPECEITLIIPKQVYELAGHSLHPYQVAMLNNFIDGMFRDILFAGVTLTQATFPTYRESHTRSTRVKRSAENQKQYRQRYIVQFRKPYIKDALAEGLRYYGITEDMLGIETVLKDYQRTIRRKLENKPAGKTFHPPLKNGQTPPAQVRTLFG